MTYRTIATLLTERALVVTGATLLSSLHLPDARVHASGHIIISGSLRSRDEEKLKLELADLIRRLANNGVATSLALDAGSKGSFLNGPLVEARHIGDVRTSKAPCLVLLETNIGTSKATVLSGERRQEVPRSGIGGHMLGLSFALLASEAFFLFFLTQLQLLALLGRRKHSAEGRRLRLARRALGLGNPLRRRLFKLDVQGQLKFEVVGDDQLEFLADGRISSQLQPCGGNAVYTIVESKTEPSTLV